MDKFFYTDIPTWDNGVWTTTSFETRTEFRDFVLSLFKEPGKYEFDETSIVFREEANKYNDFKFYVAAPVKSKDYITYWDEQKTRCRKGVIYKNKEKTWYLTREYYMWLNFLPINNKEIRKFSFPDIRDAQYHMALYEVLAELFYKHAAILKKRQIASSYFHAAKLINAIWFEETPILKIGASLKTYVNDTWRFLNEYRNFLDDNTAWYRPMNPGKVLDWQQQIETSVPGQNRKTNRGLKGVLKGTSFEKDPTAGVGGPCTYFFHEEAGIAPKMNETFGYMKPALKSGMITTGTFIAAGSVGDLDQCDPLRKMILHPEANDIFYVESNLLDPKDTFGKSGLFIPEQWSMPPCVDEFGNSKVEESLKMLDEYFEQKKKDLSPEEYQLEVSQHPRNIEEAFATRTVSIFPSHLVVAQKRRIEEKEYVSEFIDLNKNADGSFVAEKSRKIPISEFPITKNTEDKTGVIVVYEKPIKDAKWGTYYASIDPVAQGKTTSSESLCSIYVYKIPIEVTRKDAAEVTTYVEQDKIVASWCGRFDDVNKTHERLEHIIEWYNAWTLVESNVPGFITHMIKQRKQKYLVPKDQITFRKDIEYVHSNYQEYGWRNTGNIFRAHILPYLVDFCREELDTETGDDGKIYKTVYGIERIPDVMAMIEMQHYRDGLNVDRLIALGALIAFAKVQEANRGVMKRFEDTGKKSLDNSKNLYKFTNSPFRHMGNNSGGAGRRPPRSPYKNLK
jgi:hypothetical protein